MKSNRIIFGMLALFIDAGIVGCNQEDPVDEECPIATMRTNRIEQDTLCHGTWSWTHSLKWNKNFQDDWILTDTIYPGEQVEGFEIVSNSTVTVNDKEIYVVKNGVCSGGCYKYWSSAYLNTSVGPSSTVAFCLFEAWELASYFSVGVYVSDTAEVTNESLISTQLFYVYDEEGQGVRYRDRYVRIE